jgi:hypothetical protein
MRRPPLRRTPSCGFFVMAGHSRSKNGVASLAYVPAIHVFLLERLKNVDARHKAGHDRVDGKV